MMKTLAVSMAMMLSLATSAVQAQEVKWFDMDKCALCSCMAGHMELMKEMKWSVHKFAKGALFVHVIPKEHEATMDEVHKEMMAKVENLRKGESMTLCGFCQTMGEIEMSGAKIEEIESIAGPITVITASEESDIKRIHEFADRSQKEHKRVMKELAGAK